MFIEVWSDVVCPYCYLGNAQLDAALGAFDHASDVVIVPRAFELDPGMSREGTMSAGELVAAKYRQPLHQVNQTHQRLGEAANELGLEWNIDDARPTNTFDAHRLIEIARRENLAREASSRLHQAYFAEGALVSNIDTLVELAHEIGLTNPELIRDPSVGATEVREDEDRARQLGIQGVPAFVFDERFLVSGAQGVEGLLSALEQVYNLSVSS